MNSLTTDTLSQTQNNNEATSTPSGDNSSSSDSNTNAGNDQNNSQTDTPTNGNTPDSLEKTYPICPTLNYRNTSWPSVLSAEEKIAFKLSMNISGSFEGNTGWANLTNNFDGMGMSMGLLNQTLGTGSLQPLFIQMATSYNSQMQAVFSYDHYNNVKGMLETWSGKTITPTNVTTSVNGKITQGSYKVLEDYSQVEETDPLNPDERLASPLDAPDEEQTSSTPTQTSSVNNIYLNQKVSNGISVSAKMASAESNSVNWAVNNLYNGTAFKPQWKTELTNLANTPEYVSIQISAATKLHQKALTYYKRMGIKELRSYLVMYDVVVQNGSFYEQNWTDYTSWYKSNPKATTTERLKKLIDLRVANSNSKWQSDVRSRKYAILNGGGTVHGNSRKLNTEYCYTNNWDFLPIK